MVGSNGKIYWSGKFYGNFNTHSIVDIGVATVGLIGIGIAAMYSAPAIIIGITVVGTAYGFASVCGLGTTIDKASDNWGRKIMYGDQKR